MAREHSFGFVPLRNSIDGIEFMVVKAKRTGFRSFPKGHLFPGETEIDGAARELWEETGHVPVQYYSPVGWTTDRSQAILVSEVSYVYTKRSGQRVDKTVKLFLGMVEKRGEISDTDEVDSVEWHLMTDENAAVFDVEVKRREFEQQILPLVRSANFG